MNDRIQPHEFGGQTPWVGPCLGDYDCVVSTGGWLDGLPYRAAGRVWILDAAGDVLERRSLGDLDKGRKVGVEFSVSGGRPGLRGSIAFLAVPKPDQSYDTPVTMNSTIRYFGASGLEAVIGAANPIMINDFDRTGRRSSYTMVSQAACIDGPWRAISCHTNFSADPRYDRTIRLEVAAYNAEGRALGPETIAVPPFGSGWVDIVEIFGSRLRRHFAPTHGRGAYTVFSRDGAAVGYHFLRNEETGALAADHTRAIRKYIAMGYGGSDAAGATDWRGYLRNCLRVGRFLLTRKVE